MKTVYIRIGLPDSPWPGELWQIDGSVYTCGYAHGPGGELLDGNMLAEYFKVSTPNTFSEQLLLLNGFFAVAVKTPSHVFAAVDRIRSIPLFYGCTASGDLVLSERAEAVRIGVGDTEIDPVARAEFLQAGYVLGPRTLMPNVRQLQAGELLCYDRMTGEITTRRYYSYRPVYDPGIDKTSLFHLLDNVYDDVFTRLISWLNGRQVIIPLSGGYDSRLVALMFKELGYENVHCFTYDSGGARWETEISRRVAQKLGFQWHYVEYGPLAWRDSYQSEALRDYQIEAANWTSLPHIQDWPAFQQDWRGKYVSRDAVFVPGHSGDFISGTRIPHAWFDLSSISERAFKDAFSLRYLSLQGNLQASELEAIWGRLHLDADEYSIVQAVSTWQYLEWQGLQAKFIVNWNRLYEWFGYSWSMPLWDKAVLDVWGNVASTLLCEGNAYQSYVQSRGKGLPEANPTKVRTTRIRSALARVMVKSCRYNPAELAVILRQVGFNPFTYLRLMTGNGAMAGNLIRRLSAASRRIR